MTIRSDKNIPIPDPSDKTVDDIRTAVANLREIIDERMGGIQAVIAERLNSIETRLNTGFVEARASVAVALAGVVEAGKDQVIKFETLERRVAALELALSQSVGRAGGTASFGGTISQIVTIAAGLAAVATLIIAFYLLNK